MGSRAPPCRLFCVTTLACSLEGNPGPTAPRPPIGTLQVVNGPEVLSKYVGQAEENIRNLFAEAESEYKEKGDTSVGVGGRC